MKDLALWCRLVASVSIISAAFELIIPESKIKKAFNSLMSFILIFALVHPFVSNDYKISFNEILSSYKRDIDNDELLTISHNALIGAAESETERYIEEMLSEDKLTSNIDVKCSYNGERLIINSISFEGDFKAENIKQTADRIRGICSKETKIYFNGEEYG